MHIFLPLFRPLPYIGQMGVAGFIFLACLADGVFTTKSIEFIIKTKLGRLYEHRNRP